MLSVAMDVFLSYSHHDRAKASVLAAALESNGWSVWWDRQIPVGHEYRSQIQQQLDAARCIVVLWSRASLASSWVCDEATVGLNRHALVPALMEDVIPPLGFRQLQTANLVNWNGSHEADEYETIAGSIAAIIRSSDANLRSANETQFGAGEQLLRHAPLLTLTRIAFVVAVGFVIAAAPALWHRSGTGSQPRAKRDQTAVASAALSDMERLRRLREASESLSTLLTGAIDRDGDIPLSLDAQASGGRDAWTSAQCIAALLSSPTLTSGRDDVARSLRLLSEMRSRSDDGWKINTHTGVESTAWAGLAFLAALNHDDLKKQAEGELQHAYKYVSERQSEDGGWMSRELGHRQANGYTDYSTFIALRFLLELKASGWAIGASTVKDQIRHALAKVLSRNRGKGWNEAGTASPILQDLTTLHLIVLVQASQSEFKDVSVHAGFQDSITEWIPIALRNIAQREVADFTVLEQGMWAFRSPTERNAEAGYTQKAKILWHPWSLLLSGYLLREGSLTQTQAAQVSSIYDQLLGGLPKAVAAFSHDDTFKAAETLYVVNHAIAMNAETRRDQSGHR
jgi:hypothetical protein